MRKLKTEMKSVSFQKETCGPVWLTRSSGVTRTSTGVVMWLIKLLVLCFLFFVVSLDWASHGGFRVVHGYPFLQVGAEYNFPSMYVSQVGWPHNETRTR